jgi:amino acid transporter
MDAITQFELLSDAAQLAVIGGLLWAFAIVAGLMDRLRTKRRDVARLEKVGWVPWTGLMMGAAMIGGGCLLMAMSAR